MTLDRLFMRGHERTRRRASVPYPRGFAIVAFGVAALLTACSPVLPSSEADLRLVHNGTSPYGSGACFYSDASGADRMRDSRVLHWCGPEPKGLN